LKQNARLGMAVHRFLPNQGNPKKIAGRRNESCGGLLFPPEHGQLDPVSGFRKGKIATKKRTRRKIGVLSRNEDSEKRPGFPRREGTEERPGRKPAEGLSTD